MLVPIPLTLFVTRLDALLTQLESATPAQTHAVRQWAWLLMVLSAVAVAVFVVLVTVTLRRRRRLLREANETTNNRTIDTPDPWTESARRLDMDALDEPVEPPDANP